MTHPFEISGEITVPATPEQAWQAITNGPQVDSWFMGRTQIEPRPGGRVVTDMGDFAMESTVVAWEPGKRYANRGELGPDGAQHGFEFTIEGRGGSTVVRFVHSGFLAGDDWEAEYHALQAGDPMYLHKLAQYLTYFAPRAATRNIFAVGPHIADRARVWSVLGQRLGLTGAAKEGDPVRATLAGTAIDGVVDVARPEYLGIRTADGLFRFIHGHDGSIVAEHHDFASSPNPNESAQSWQTWMTEAYA